MQKKVRTLALWLCALLVFLIAFTLLNPTPPLHVDWANFQADVEEGLIAEVRIENNQLTITHWDGLQFQTLGVVDEDLTRTLSEQGVVIAYGPEERPIRRLLIIVGPLILILVLFVYFLKKSGSQTMNALSMRKSTARLIDDEGRCTFEDVGGCEDAKEQLRDLIDFLKHPERWTEAGVRLPRGVLLEGPPGCGKTLLARAVAGESEAAFYLVSASEFVEMFVGVGAARVRDTFETASKNAPSVIFIDEIDAVGRKRGSGIGASHDEREQTLNQILVCMDGFSALERVVVIAATNRSDVLDAALLRPGRFDRRIEIPVLSRDQRRAVLGIHTRNKKLADDVDLDALADRSANQTGADLECLCNEAGLLAVRRMRREEAKTAEIRMADFADAREGRQSESRRFDCVDAVLVESTTQLAYPTGKAHVRLTMQDGSLIEGEIAWADATMMKLRANGAGDGAIVPKHMVKCIEALDGTELTSDIAPDRWAGHRPDTA